MAERASIPWFHRLYTRIYLSVLAIIALLVVMWALAEYSHSTPDEYDLTQRMLATTVAETLPSATAPNSEQQRVLARWQSSIRADMALYGADGRLLAVAGISPWISNVPRLRLTRLGAEPPDYPMPLTDGRWLLLHERGLAPPRRHRPAILFGLMALVIGVACYAIARRLTRRLENLQRSVTAWGSGVLSERVKVEGRDEVAALARSFNASAEKIDSLMRSQKALLSNASHELRSPLARLRIATELLPKAADESLRAELRRNIAELDQLVGEILLASRLDALGKDALAGEISDFTALVAEESAAVGALLEAVPSRMHGDSVLLRRLLRNLLENARRYSGNDPVQVRITTDREGIELTVSDNGPGIAESERERVFEPFHRLPGASESDGGVGLGLSLVRQIASAHGGMAECVAPKMSGACFRVWLPSLKRVAVSVHCDAK